MSLLIAFSGKARSGKTTCAKILKEIYQADLKPYKEYAENEQVKYRETDALIFPFADDLKRYAKELTLWDGDKTAYYNEDGSLDLTRGRGILIDFGTYRMRAMKPTIWADMLMKRVYLHESLNPEQHPWVGRTLYLVDDMRFRNELEVVKTFDKCVTVRVIRPDGQLDIDDISEKDLDASHFDFYIRNEGTIEELKAKLIDILAPHIKI